MKLFIGTNRKDRSGIHKLFMVFLILLGSLAFSVTLLGKSSIAQSLQPPSTFYGWITPTTGFVPTAGMTVKALINGLICGQTTVETKNSKLAYTLQVTAENPVSPTNGCGTTARTIIFQVGTWTMNHDRLWNNNQAWFHSLSQVKAQARNLPLENVLYLPLVQRQL